jgi:hypothetical protein
MKHIVEHTRNILDSKTKLWEHYFPVIPAAMIINSMLKEKNCMILSTVVFVTPVQPSQTLLNAFMVNNAQPACSNQILSMKKKRRRPIPHTQPHQALQQKVAASPIIKIQTSGDQI